MSSLCSSPIHAPSSSSSSQVFPSAPFAAGSGQVPTTATSSASPSGTKLSAAMTMMQASASGIRASPQHQVAAAAAIRVKSQASYFLSIRPDFDNHDDDAAKQSQQQQQQQPSIQASSSVSSPRAPFASATMDSSRPTAAPTPRGPATPVTPAPAALPAVMMPASVLSFPLFDPDGAGGVNVAGSFMNATTTSIEQQHQQQAISSCQGQPGNAQQQQQQPHHSFAIDAAFTLTPAELASSASNYCGSTAAINFFKTRARTDQDPDAAGWQHHVADDISSDDESLSTHSSTSSGDGAAGTAPAASGDGGDGADGEHSGGGGHGGASGNGGGGSGGDAQKRNLTQQQRLKLLADDHPHSILELLGALNPRLFLGSDNGHGGDASSVSGDVGGATAIAAAAAGGAQAAATSAAATGDGAADTILIPALPALAAKQHRHNHHHHHPNHDPNNDFAANRNLVVPMKLSVRGSRIPCGIVTISARLGSTSAMQQQTGRQHGRGGAAANNSGGGDGETDLADELHRRMTGHGGQNRPTFTQVTRAVANFGRMLVSGVSDNIIRGGGGGGGGGVGGANNDNKGGEKNGGGIASFLTRGGGGSSGSRRAASADDDMSDDEEYGNFDIKPRAVRAPNAYLIDHPGMMGVRRRKIIASPCYRGSIIAFAGKKETAEDLDRQFLLRHPFCKPLNLRLSVFRALKSTMLQMALRDGVIDVASVAYAVCYIERLIMRKLVNGDSLHLVAATCLLIACKFNEETKESTAEIVKYVQQKSAELLGVTASQMMRAEIHVLVALKFELHVHETYVKRQWVRLLGSPEAGHLSPAEYIGFGFAH